MTAEKEFISAFLTDTRLMGVVGMYVHWKLPDNSHLTDLHQFFILTPKKPALIHYRSVLGDGGGAELEEIQDIENYLMGGLGGTNISISEKEARYMLQSYVDLNMRSNLPLPEGSDECGFMLASHPADRYGRVCAHVQTVSFHRFRPTRSSIISSCVVFGRDFGAAKFLTKRLCSY